MNAAIRDGQAPGQGFRLGELRVDPDEALTLLESHRPALVHELHSDPHWTVRIAEAE